MSRQRPQRPLLWCNACYPDVPRAYLGPSGPSTSSTGPAWLFVLRRGSIARELARHLEMAQMRGALFHCAQQRIADSRPLAHRCCQCIANWRKRRLTQPLIGKRIQYLIHNNAVAERAPALWRKTRPGDRVQSPACQPAPVPRTRPPPPDG